MHKRSRLGPGYCFCLMGEIGFAPDLAGGGMANWGYDLKIGVDQTLRMP